MELISVVIRVHFLKKKWDNWDGWDYWDYKIIGRI